MNRRSFLRTLSATVAAALAAPAVALGQTATDFEVIPIRTVKLLPRLRTQFRSTIQQGKLRAQAKVHSWYSLPEYRAGWSDAHDRLRAAMETPEWREAHRRGLDDLLSQTKNRMERVFDALVVQRTDTGEFGVVRGGFPVHDEVPFDMTAVSAWFPTEEAALANAGRPVPEIKYVLPFFEAPFLRAEFVKSHGLKWMPKEEILASGGDRC